MKHEINKTCCDQTGSHWGPQAGFFQINPCQLLSKTITFHYFYYQTKLRRPIFGYIYIYALLWSRPKLYDYIYIPIAAKWFKVGTKSCSSFSFCFVHKYNLMKSEEKDIDERNDEKDEQFMFCINYEKILQNKNKIRQCLNPVKLKHVLVDLIRHGRCVIR